MKKTLSAAAFGCLMLAATPAWASSGYTLAGVNLRAGPGTGYPVVAQMPPGIGLEIQGCLAGNAWCDVVSGPLRGWVSGRYIGGAMGGTPVAVTHTDLPTLIFNLSTYWDSHYRARSFYRDRDHYRHKPQPYHVKQARKAQPQAHHAQPQPQKHQPPQQQQPRSQHEDCRAPGGHCR